MDTPAEERKMHPGLERAGWPAMLNRAEARFKNTGGASESAADRMKAARARKTDEKFHQPVLYDQRQHWAVIECLQRGMDDHIFLSYVLIALAERVADLEEALTKPADRVEP